MWSHSDKSTVKGWGEVDFQMGGLYYVAGDGMDMRCHSREELD